MAAKKKTKKKASAKSAKSGRPLVIVESPAKARTVGKFLGRDYMIEASIGHVRDLPANATEIPAAYKKEKWARLGIDVDEDFKPLYVVPKVKRDQLKKLKAKLKDADSLLLATDEDREGESISWHLIQELKPKVEVRRLVFHEITEAAIRGALENPREIDMDLVEAQEARRLVDRLYGYSVSPLLWKKVRPKLSAGRVQSVAIRLVVEREEERLRFNSADWWGLKGHFAAGSRGSFDAQLISLDGTRVAIGKDFDPETGQLKEVDKPPIHLLGKPAVALATRLSSKMASVVSLEQKPYTERPAPPFTTSTLQQEAGRKLRFTAQRTMRAAQRLYENGHITYMRTDSTTLSNEALTALRKFIEAEYGPENVPDEPRVYKTKVRNAQEAHEAIRPAGSKLLPPKELPADIGPDELKIYELIYRRTVACQMRDAKGKRTTLQLDIEEARFQATGKTIEFPGFRLVYVEGAENGDQKEQAADAERVLPHVEPGEKLETEKVTPEGHTTQPPARLTEASLIKELEARGIGRPSTYASIIETIQARAYCFKKGSALLPTFTAFAVVRLLKQFLPHLVDYTFTARMEDDLDEISNGRIGRVDYLKGFFLGNGKPGLRDRLEKVEQDIDPREVCSIKIGHNDDGVLVEARVGRYGPYLSCGDDRVGIPEDLPPDELTLEKAVELLAKGASGAKSLGVDPDTGLDVFVKVGRFGPYFQLGDPDKLDGEKPKMASLLKGMDPETTDLDEAIAVLSLPRIVGRGKNPKDPDNPEEENDVLAANGRFGPYLKWGKETRSIPEDYSPLTIDMAKALELFAQPKARGRRSAQAKILRELGEHPDSKAPLKILDGRYGPYVTDGTTNASLPRGTKPEDLGMDQAVDLLAARAAAGPSKKKAKKKTRKKATKKTAKKVRS